MGTKNKAQETQEPEVQGYCPGCDEPRIDNWIWHKPCCPYDPGDNCDDSEKSVKFLGIRGKIEP